MKRIAVFAAAALAAALPARAGLRAGDGEVRAVSVLPAAGKVEVVVALRGAVSVQDFTLTGPARLVLDLQGARLTGRPAAYDGQNRGGVKNVRVGQYRNDVVRVVIDLDALRDYTVRRDGDRLRVDIGTDQASFAAWTSDVAADAAMAPAPDAAAAGATPDAAAPVATPRSESARQIDAYLAAHQNQSQAPRLTVTWDGADIADVVGGFAAFSGRTIVLGKDVKGTVTAEIKNQPWDLAFNAVLESQGLAAQTLPGGIINVVNKVDLARADSTVPVETRLVRINYAKAASLVPAVQGIVSKRGSVVADTVNNALVITDVENRIDQVQQFVQGLDRRTPQVSIQAKLIFVDRTDLEQFGIKYDLGTGSQCVFNGSSPCAFYNRLIQRGDFTQGTITTPGGQLPTTPYDQSVTYVTLGGNALAAIGNAGAALTGTPALDLVYTTALGNYALTSFIQALEQVSLADVQAEPSITTVDNRQAQILVGARVPIRVIDVSAPTTGATNVPRATVNFQQVGINLQVTPHVTNNRQVLMEVHAERSNIQQEASDLGFTFQTQQADNQILVNDGETAVVGGLTVTQVTVSKSGIPFLVDLPILGKLFGFTSQQEERQDLLILVTPHIIDDLAPAGAGN